MLQHLLKGARQLSRGANSMAANVRQLLALQHEGAVYSYTQRSTVLYAISVGMGRDPLDVKELDFAYERTGKLRAIPSQAVTVARHDLIYNVGLDIAKLLHGEQVLRLHQPMPVSGELRANHRVVDVIDKGQKGLIIETESKVYLSDGTPLFDVNDLYFARGDGGMEEHRPTPPRRPSHALPERAPDVVRNFATLPWHALLYRLNGDRGAIHAEPQAALAAGFEAPILHGSCLLGIACREILASVCGYDPGRIASLGTRFTAAFYPGERLETEIWIEDDIVSFRCRALERGTIVLDKGRCELTPLVSS